MLGKIHWRFLSKKFLHFPRKLKSPKNIFITIVSVCTLCVGLVYSNCGSQISEIGQNNFIHEAGVTDDASPNLHETPESTFKVGVPAKTGETAKADAGVVDGRSTEVKDPAGVKDPIACTNRNGSPCAIVVDTGQYFSCAIVARQVQCWGDNRSGQLGQGSPGPSYSTTPLVVPKVTNVSAIAVGTHHVCIVSSGNVVCWGGNANGQVGNGTMGLNVYAPYTIPNLTGVIELVAGQNHTCALQSTGQVKCWGWNKFGQLGLGTTIPNYLTPTTIPSLTGITSIAAGELNTCALRGSQAFCWGWNDHGQVGNGVPSTLISVPYQIPTLSNTISIATGNGHSCAVTNTNEVYCWGQNQFGQATGANNPQLTPLNTGVTNATQVSTGGENSCAVKSSGDVACWGYNKWGQLGNGVFTGSNPIPQNVLNITNATQVSAGSSHTCVVNGTSPPNSVVDVQCFGQGYNGALGNGLVNDQNVPVYAFQNYSCCGWEPTSLVNAPTPRISTFNNQDSVWTGSRMIIWGGWDGTNSFGDGSAYDPVTDMWNTLNPVGAPSPRWGHTVIWAGAPINRMIVWGGTHGVVYYNDGRVYNPLTNSWMPMSTIGAPSPRYLHTAVWTGTEMIVWGGFPPASGQTGDGARYNPMTNTWTPMSSVGAPSIRNENTAIWAGAPINRMIVWGGQSLGLNSRVLSDGAMYDPNTDTWTSMSNNNAPAERRSHTSVWTGSEMIVSAGLGGPTGSTNLNSGGRFNPLLNTWSPIANSPQGGSWHTAIWTGSPINRMIEWGNGNMHSYDPSTDMWTPLCPGANSHSSHFATWTGTQMIVWGGLNPYLTNQGWIYTP